MLIYKIRDKTMFESEVCFEHFETRVMVIPWERLFQGVTMSKLMS